MRLKLSFAMDVMTINVLAKVEKQALAFNGYMSSLTFRRDFSAQISSLPGKDRYDRESIGL